MHTWICLLRGIGGKYTLPSADFIEILASLNASDVKTYIATGNAVFRSRSGNRITLATKIAAGINERRGFEPKVLLLTPDELRAAIAGNPFPAGEKSPTTLHLAFLSEVPRAPELERLEALKSDGEDFLLRERMFYLYTPNGAGRSKLIGRFEKRLGVWATARDWRSCCRILELADALA